MYMHENEDFAPGIIFSSQKHLWVIGLYTNSYMESSTTLSKRFIFMQETIIFMHGIIIFMQGNFIFTHENEIFLNKMFMQQIFHEWSFLYGYMGKDNSYLMDNPQTLIEHNCNTNWMTHSWKLLDKPGYVECEF